MRDSYEGVFLIKFHAFDKNIAKKFKFRSVLFIVRNPYDAFIAEYNRENTGGNHLGILNEERFYSAGTILSLVGYQNEQPLSHAKSEQDSLKGPKIKKVLMFHSRDCKIKASVY